MESVGPQCPVKIRLVQEYFEATRLYSAALAEFNEQLAKVLTTDYSNLNRMVDKARRHSEDARDRLTRHIADDHC